MRKTPIARSTIKYLEEQIKTAESKKKEILNFLNSLKEKHDSGKISYSEYVENIYLKREGLDLKEWIVHLDVHIRKCRKEIKKRKREITGIRATNILLFSFVLIFILGSSFYIQPKFIGFVVQEQPQEFFDLLNMEFNGSQTYLWAPQNSGKLESMKISGSIYGDGEVKVYLGDLLVFDSSYLEKSENNPGITGGVITGFVTLGDNSATNETGEQINNTLNNSEEITSLEENKTFSNETASAEINNSSSEEINFTEVPENEGVGLSQQEPLSSEENVSKQAREFSNICEETCDLSSFNLSRKSYEIKVETSNANLKIDRIVYTFSQAEEIANITEENLTSMSQANIIAEETVQQQAVLGQPVKWTKTVKLDKEGIVKVKIPDEAKNINVSKVENNEKTYAGLITGNVISEDSGFFSGLSPITGNVIKATKKPKELELEISENATEYEIEYETPAPYAIETEKPKGKEVKIIGSKNIHYENVLAFTNLSENLQIKNPSSVKIKWVENNTFIIPETIVDKDSNGIYDYVEWLAPSLSNQTFEIIVITKAEHLDSNREFISDIYDYVNETDNVTYTIPENEYARAYFITNLTSENVIDVIVYNSNGATIEVYEKDSNVMVGKIDITEDGFYATKLNHTGSQDIFDLKSINGNVEYDYIHDAWTLVACNLVAPTVDPNIDTGNQFTLSCATRTDGSQSGYTSTVVTARYCTSGPGCTPDTTIPSSNGLSTATANPQTCSGSQCKNVLTQFDFTINANTAGSYTVDCRCVGNGNLNTADQDVTVNAVSDNPPTFSDLSVNDSTPIPGTATVLHNVLWTDDTAMSYATLEINSTGVNCDTTANISSTTLSGSPAWANLSWLVPNVCEGKTIGWKQYANDSANQFNVTDLQTYTAGNINPTATFGENPVDDYNSSSGTITFDLKVSDNLDVNYLALYGNWTGLWVANQTNSSPVNDAFWSATIQNIPEGKWIWTAWGNDTAGNSAFTTANRTFIVDLTNPSSTIDSPANNTAIRDNTPNIQFTLTDNLAPSLTYNIYVNDLMNKTGSASESAQTNVTLNEPLPDGQSLVIVEAVDSSERRTNSSALYLTIDTTPPYFTTLVNQSSFDNESLNYDINAADDGAGMDSFAIDDTTNFSINPSTGVITNITTLIQYYYIVNVSINDTIGNLDWSLWSLNVTSSVVPNSAPTVPIVDAIDPTDPTIGSATSITFYFNVTDTDGYANINTSSANASFSRTGEATRYNSSCAPVFTPEAGNSVNFSCIIDMQYYDQNGAWTINATVQDINSATGYNESTTFTYNLQTAMTMSPNALSWTGVGVTSTNTGATENPILINNTGNDEPLNIDVTTSDLQGNTTTTEYIYASNFTVENAADGCSGTAMVNGTATNVTSAILQRGDNSISAGDETSGQEQIYFCLKGVQTSPSISSQGYNSDYGVWTVEIQVSYFLAMTGKVAYLLAAMGAKGVSRKKKKQKSRKIEDDKLLEALSLITDELKTEYSLNKKELTKVIISKLQRRYGVSNGEILEIIENKELQIPASIFSKELGALESLARYMKENLNMTYHNIAEKLERDERTIWASCKKSKEKQKEPLKAMKTDIMIPLSIFENKKLTILESAILYLKGKGMRFSEIGKLLERDERNIWTTYSRAIKKMRGINNE